MSLFRYTQSFQSTQVTAAALCCTHSFLAHAISWSIRQELAAGAGAEPAETKKHLPNNKKLSPVCPIQCNGNVYLSYLHKINC